MKPFNTFLRSNTGYIIFLLVFSIAAFEIILRVIGINETYSESIGQGYQNYFNQVSNNYYQTWRANDTFTLDHKDFRFFYKTNELGVREIASDSFQKKSRNSYRIITLGDSFTEGVGAPYDSSFAALLEKFLHKKGTNAHVFNAGSCGSDPFYYYTFYRDKLITINPNLVIIAINASDIDDYFYRGGMERFIDNGTVVNRKGPWFEPLYHYSFIFRFILVNIFQKQQQLLVNNKEYDLVMDKFKNETAAVLKNFKALLPASCKMLVVIFPPPAAAFNNADSGNIKAKQVLEALLAETQKADIDTLNLFPPFELLINNNNRYDYTFKNDGHFTPKGYAAFATYLLPKADSLLKTTVPQLTQ